jgi:site-specific DNA recombinase
VREIFETYLREKSLTAAISDLNAHGWTTKSWVKRKGNLHAGAPFDKSRLHRLLPSVT